MRAFICILIVIAIPVLVDAATLKVPSQYPTIQGAIDAAVDGDTVLVAPGTYVENIDFKGKAITVMSSSGPYVTTIDGGKPTDPEHGSVATFQNNEKLNSVLDGFTLTNGTGTKDGPFYSGKGIYCDTSYLGPTIANNIITGNWPKGVWSEGGGIKCMSAKIVNNIIFKNVSDGCGGIHCAGDAHIIANNVIYNNYGIGIQLSNQILSKIVNNVIYGNKGEGIVSYGAEVIIANTILWDNEGFEIRIVKFVNDPILTISYSDVEGGKSSVEVTPGSTLNWGESMIYSDPLFVDPDGGDFHINYNSPCRCSGINKAPFRPEYDFEGDPRIAYGTVDMGADEFYTHIYYTGDATPGGNVEVKFVGLPGTVPVGLCIGTGILEPLIPSIWGDWYLQFPIIGPINLGKIPSPDGVLVVPGIIPGSPPPPYSIPMQALIGAELTNLCVLEVK